MKLKTCSWEFIPEKNRKVSILFHFLGFGSISLGFHIDIIMMNMEIHLPFCFIRIGKSSVIAELVQYRGDELR